MRALIADDEPFLRAELRDMLSSLWPQLAVRHEVSDGVAALRALAEEPCDIVFLDVRMPHLTGLEVADQIQGQAHIVFVTAFDEHAVDAFERGAVDYLLKPVRHSRLNATIVRLKQRFATEAKSQPLRWIQATSGKTTHFFRMEEIVYFEADNKYTHVVTSTVDGFIRRPLVDLLASLDSELFWQVHRGTIVNATMIERVVRDERGDMRVKLRGHEQLLPISKAYQSRFKML